MRLAMAIVVFTLSAGPAVAGGPWLPNGTPDRQPGRQPNFSCQNFQAVARDGDPQVMEALSGVWENDTIMRTLGPPTRVHQSVQRWSTGQLIYNRAGCIPSPLGGPPSCSRWGGHGYWSARMGQGGWIIFSNWLQGSGPTGELEAPSCASFPIRLLDPNTTQFQDGSTVRRTAR